MPDTTEDLRRSMIEAGVPEADLEGVLIRGERFWDTQQLTTDFEVLGFATPFVVARKRDTGERGSLEFTHRPRLYFGWEPDAKQGVLF